jgi:hypothetical protein
VSERFRIFAGWLMFSWLLSTTTLQGQILKDTAAINLLKRGVDDIYNFRFDDARDISQKLYQSFPEHPVVFLFNGMIKYWENYPLIPSSPVSGSYENDMTSCIRVCEETNNPPDYAEYLLSNLGARGMLLMYYADNNLSEKVIPLTKSTYRYLRQSFGYTFVYPDFYFFTGLYNYYREAYPDAHPIYKMLAFLFPKGDRTRGLEEMQTASRLSIMLKGETSSFLSYIYISFENDYQQAFIYSESRHLLYPANLAYLADYIKTLLLLKRYDDAEIIIGSSDGEVGNSYFQAQLSIFNGILQEKKYHDYAQAKKYYSKGIGDLSAFGYYGNEYTAYAFFGLSRISDIDNQKHNKKVYRKKALELTSYKKVNFDE